MSGLAPLVYTSGFGFIGFWYLGKRERERERVSQPASQSSSKSANQLRNCPPPAQYYRVPPPHNNINVLCSLLISFLVTGSYLKRNPNLVCLEGHLSRKHVYPLPQEVIS